MSELYEYLSSLPAGPNADRDELLRHLVGIWHSLAGSTELGMDASKLHRIENPSWQPPLLTFDLERHGAIMGGASTRAQMQHWVVDAQAGTVEAREAGFRQAGAMTPRLDVRPLVEEIVGLIAKDADDDRLTWSDDRRTVRVNIGRVIPDDGFKQTVAGRRKRFRSALDEHLVEHGWDRTATPYRYSR